MSGDSTPLRISLTYNGQGNIMPCFQCQKTAKNTGCTVRRVYSKSEKTVYLHDLLIYVCRGISVYREMLKANATRDNDAGRFICEDLFTIIANVTCDDEVIIDRIRKVLKMRDAVKENVRAALSGALPDCAS